MNDTISLRIASIWRCSSRAAVNTVSVRDSLLASGYDDGSLKIWDLTTGKVLYGFLPSCFDGEPTSIVWLSAASLVVSAGQSIHRLQFNPKPVSSVTSTAAQTWEVSNEEINSICLLDHRRLAVGDDEGRVQILNMDTSVLKAVDDGLKHLHICTAVVHQKLTGLLISGGMDSKIKVWNTKQYMLASQIDVNLVRQADPGSLQVVNPPYVNALVCHEKRIAAGLGDGSVLLAEQRGSKKTWNFQALEGHTFPVGALCFIGSSMLMSSSNDKTCRLWDLNSMTCIASLSIGYKVNSMALVDERTVILGDVSGQLLSITICGPGT